MFDLILGLFLFLSPIFFLPRQIGNINALQYYQFGVLGNMGYNYLQLQFFCYGVVILLLIALLSKPQREFNDKWMVILLSLFCLNVYFHPIGIRMFAPIFLGFLLLYLVVVYTKNYKSLFKFIFFTSLLNITFAILQFFNVNLIFSTINTSKIFGLMYLSTHLGAYQVIALPICYAINPLLVIVPIIGIILSKSITAIVIMLCWFIFKSFIGIRTQKGIFHITSYPVLMALFSLLVFFILHNWGSILQKINIRLIVWLPTIKEISYKILGYGIEPFRFNSPKVGLYENPCSIYLQAVRYFGILVLIPVFFIIKKIIAFKNNILSESLLIALLVGIEKSLFDFPRLAGTVIVLFGFLMIAKGEINAH